MEWQVIAALVVMIPVISFPVLFVWYLNTEGIIAFIGDKLKVRKVIKIAAEVPVDENQ